MNGTGKRRGRPLGERQLSATKTDPLGLLELSNSPVTNKFMSDAADVENLDKSLSKKEEYNTRNSVTKLLCHEK